MDNKKPSILGQSGRRKSGGNTQLRSPIVKRPAMAPVSLQGWLHKQGSEGLMLWKKRWFVLSEYCLFYYKGPEEEKLLGSILLPSYKVSPCTADDKIYRKFAFKAEHANMRTYYFAAETREVMTQWMNALSLATILQENIKIHKPLNTSSMNSLTNHSADDSDSGFQTYRLRTGLITNQSTGQDQKTNEGNLIVNGWTPQSQKNPCQPLPCQPLYANAPPKPKRLNENQYGNSSPDASRNEDVIIYGNHHQIQQERSHYLAGQRIMHGGHHPGSLPHPDIIRTMPTIDNYLTGMPGNRIIQDLGLGNNVMIPNSITRSPDNVGHLENYTDVYKSGNRNTGMDQRPESSAHVNYVKSVNPAFVNYQHFNQHYQGYHQLSPTSSSLRYQCVEGNNSRRDKQPPRPHSADFLDLDSKYSYQYPQMSNADKLNIPANQNTVMRPQRPKSSLDVIHTNDGYYWSEESYAEKMRQSSMYLQNTLPQRSQSSRSNTPSFKQASDMNRVPAGPGTGKNDRPSVITRLQSEGGFGDDDLKSPPRPNAKRWSEYEAGGNHFFRSASARLARNRAQDDESDEVQTYTGGEDFKEDGKKEESMKRLMEWKQRMLQSPLTKKPSGSSTRGSAQNELSKFYKHQVLRELERQEARSREELGKKRSKPEGIRVRSRSTDGRRSAMSSSRYNSYSSDDEENCETRKERNRRPSLSGKTRKITEDLKVRKSISDSSKGSRFLSPDYENLTQQQSRVHSQTMKIADRDVKISDVGEETQSKSLLNANSIDESFPEHDDDKYGKMLHSEKSLERESIEMINQPILEYEPHADNEGLNWDEKIDGINLIKEFSYHYVKNVPFKAIDVPSYKVLETPPENIVKSRIKQLGLEGKESDCRDVNLKEPLKLSSPTYQTNEAHVSTLKNIGDRRSNKSLRDFALGEPVRIDVEEASNQKSVKDLLADFERKSQLAQEKENEKSFEESPGKRYVFSDTETLLYDTSSDTEDKNEKPDSSLLMNLNRSESKMRGNTNLTEEEDGDEEVAEALGRRERLFSSCKDLGRKDHSENNVKRFENANVDDEQSPSSEVETIMTPGYLMSNLTESVIIREQSDSTYSTPVRVIEKMKDDLERSLPKENLVKSPDMTSKEDMEGHYMPMTPSRRVSAPPSDKSRSNSSLHSILYGAEVEETYVEMSENGTNNMEINKSFMPKNAYSDFNSYCEIPGGKPESHYDFLYKTGSFREPEYMEVNTLLEILKEQDEKIKEHKGAIEKSKLDRKINNDIGPPPPCRSALPDILNSSATNQQKSDSSDADDESSKDLGSLDIPRHPRFSLSDTFRPASYYLGNDNGRSLIGIPNPSENQDSSDSDLVSPPPIPTSPPPLDDLDTSLETEKSLETRPKLKISEKDASKRLWSKPNRSDFDISEEYKKIKRRPVSEDVLETLNESDQIFYEKKLSVSELDSIGSRNGLVLDEETNNINLNQYLNSLEFVAPVNPQLYSKNINESIYKSYEKELHKNLMPKDCGSKTSSPDKGLMKELKLKYGDEAVKRNGESSSFGKKAADHVQYENLQNLFPPPPLELYDSSNDFSLGIYRNISLAYVPPPENYCDIQNLSHQPQIQFDPDTLQQHGETTCKSPEVQGAPYYYSDIIKKDEEEFGSSTSDRSLSSLRSHLSVTRYQPLNNQREDLQEMALTNKRNNIGRKVNPISQAVETQDEAGVMDDMQRITEELRTTTAHFMDAADKSEHFDMRNIYESDTLQRRKTSIPVDTLRVSTPDLSHPQNVARNLYPHGLRDKSKNLTSTDLRNVISTRRSRSLEGLLNETETNNCESSARSFPSHGGENPCIHQGRSNRNNSCDGDDLWEKDTLWRENLRKASLRHARSLDNLDENNAIHSRPNHLHQNGQMETSGRRSVDHLMPLTRNVQTFERQSVEHFTSKPKLNRDVTYVNDVFRRNRPADVAREYEQDYREGRIRSKKKEPEGQRVVELSDSGVLDCDDGVHYERLTRNNPDRRQMVDIFIENYEWDENREMFRKNESKEPSYLRSENHGQQLRKTENLRMEPIDREKLRQWDLMSSGIVEQQESTGREAESKLQERSLENSEEKTAEGEAKKFSTPKVETQQETISGAEASASGSVMRETPISHAMSGPSEGQQHSPRFVQKSLTTSKGTVKDEGFADLETLPNETYDHLVEGLSDKIDYYDRGKNSYPNIVNGYSDWSDCFSNRKSEVRDYIKNVPGRRRLAESDFYLEQYPDEKIMPLYNRNCGTLPMTKGTNFVPMPSLNLQGSSVGRSLGTLDSRTLGKKKISSGTWGLDVSAGELLGRTHEELVLLLIQLRRQSAGVCKAMETCHIEIEAQARLANMETPKRMEHIQKLEELKKHLLDLEKQYEKGKPLVNLVDNMVKLGSLYRGNNNHSYNGSVGLDHSFNVREKLEFNQKVQEQRLLAEERRDWDRLSPDHSQLQAKVQQLYRLDRLLQEESGTLHCLQQDKELLEKALGGLRHKLQINKSNPIEADRCRKQQKLLEKELSRVRLLLAHNSKKLEETVAENARLEQELVILRQKLQASRVSSRNSAPLLPESITISTTAALEAELRRVQLLVGDLQRQRHELSAQVKQLTEKSDTLVQQIRPGPTGVAGAGPIPGKKKSSSSWLETDLDLLVTQDVGVESPVISPQHHQQPPSIESLSPKSTTPIYINTEPTKREGLAAGRDSKSPIKAITPSGFEPEKMMTYRTPVELSEADERTKRFYGIIPREKQEIKTVRIVKRESERRQRDRDRNGNIGIPIGNTALAKRVSVIEENDPYILSKVEEESLDNYQGSPNFSEQSEDYQSQKLNGEFRMDIGDDPYMNFHPTNPFLPQNIANLQEATGEEPSSSNRSMSLPRGFGKSSSATRSPPIDGGSLKSIANKRNRVRFENQFQEESASESGCCSPKNNTSPSRNFNSPAPQIGYLANRQPTRAFGNVSQRPFSPNPGYFPNRVAKMTGLDQDQREYLQVQVRKQKSPDFNRPLSAREQLFGANYLSPDDENSPQLSPVYQSEAAREIIMEMSSSSGRSNTNRRQIPREKRRHHTVSNIQHTYDNEHFCKMNAARSRDDLDMERALRPRINAPDVVRSTMSHKDLKYNESTIDNILGTPNKIIIPERYIPEQEPVLTAEEQLQRLKKAESIRKMLSETTALSTPDLSKDGAEEDKKSSILRKKVEEEKKQREHLLELNQILAQQVMEKSKLVAVKAMAALPLEQKESIVEEEDLSPVQPLPLYQQRENYFS